MSLCRFKAAIDPRLVDVAPIELRRVRRSQWQSAVQWKEFRDHGLVEALADAESGQILILYSDSTRMNRLQAEVAGALFDVVHCPLSYSECVNIAAQLVAQSIAIESVVWY